MANYSNLLATIAANIYTNGNNEVTAAMVKAALDAVVASLAAGFIPKGVATPATDPQSPDEKVQYLATTPGTYTNFGGIVINAGEVAIIKGSGTSWSKEVTGAATAAQIADVEYRALGVPNVNIPAGVEVLNGHINTSGVVQNSNYRHVLIPVTNCRGFKVSVNFTDYFAGSQWAFIASVNGNQYNFVSGGSRHSGAVVEETIPADANYLYVVVADNITVHAGYVSFRMPQGNLAEQLNDVALRVTSGHLPLPERVPEYAYRTAGKTSAPGHFVLAPIDVREWIGLTLRIKLSTSATASIDKIGFTNDISDLSSIQWGHFAEEKDFAAAVNNEIDLVVDGRYLLISATILRCAQIEVTPDRAIISTKLDARDVLEIVSHNMINPANVAFDRRYSTGQTKIIAADAQLIASSGLVEVKEGEWYTVSGAGLYVGPQGGYFGPGATGEIGETSLGNITFSTPVDGLGYCFQVPAGYGIKYALVSLSTNADHTALAGNVQLELGEMATDYRPYLAQEKIKAELIPESSGGGGSSTQAGALDTYTRFGNLTYPGAAAKIPNFLAHWMAKDKDLVVVNTGTSLTARSTEHCTERADAAYRPPMMQARNFASHIWDRLIWQGQQYRRYDSGFFTESGTGWQTQSNVADWDDGAYRAGLTRYTDNAGSVAFVVPKDAWQFNFIIRKDSLGGEAVTITIAEGNGKMEVWNGAAWVEANGFVFSEREAAETILPSISYTNPNTGAGATLSNYQVKGNTTYQARVKMRCKSSLIDSRSETKSVTISSTSGRLLYWGVEWSPREYMITYINAARGSHNSLINSTRSLLHFQDNEVWSFAPDLLLSEDPIHNSGAAHAPEASTVQAYFGNVSEGFWFANNGISMKSRAAALGLPEPEWALFNTSISWNFGGITDDGLLEVAPLANGLMWSALESQASVYMYMLANHPEIIYINAVKNWVDACMACYESMRAATEGSGKAGITFTDEGSHWNDTGCKVMARVVLPILDFVI